MDVDARADLPMQPFGPLQPGPSGAFRAEQPRPKGEPAPPPSIWRRCAKMEVRGAQQESMRQGTKGAGAQEGQRPQTQPGGTLLTSRGASLRRGVRMPPALVPAPLTLPSLLSQVWPLLSLNHQPDLASLGEPFLPSPDPSLLCNPSPPD